MANTTITPNSGILRLSRSFTVIAATGALALAGSAPTIPVQTTTVTPNTGALVVTHVNPTRAINAGALSLTGLAPTISIGGTSLTIAPNSGRLLLELAPNIITPATASLGMVGQQPVQTLTLPTITRGVLSLQGQAPAILPSNIITPNPGALVLAGQSVQIGTVGTIIPPTADPLSFQGQTPGILLNTVIPAGALSLASDPPQVLSTSNTQITPAGFSLGFAGYPPSVIETGPFNQGWSFDDSGMTFDNPGYTFDGLFTGVNQGAWPLPSAITNLPVRGCWSLPGGTQALWVIGSGCFLMTVKTAATGSAQATFNLQRVGTLSSNTGPVSIRDNGVGGVAVIVDGPNGYFYTIATKAFVKITDPDFVGATHVAFIDGWWVFNQPNSQVFYTPNSTYTTIFNASNFALKDGSTDLLVALYENKEELWLIGAKTTEVWYDAGGTFFAFQRLVSTMLQVGCAAKYSVARFNAENEDGLIWLAQSERGQNVVIKISGFTANVVSTPAVNEAIASYTKIDDAIGYTYQEDGHEFYVLTFPSAVNQYGGLGVTWVYDGSVGPDLGWSQRLAFEPYAGVWYRHRSNCFLNFQNQRLVGDFQNGSIYRLDRKVYTDNGWPLVAWRRTPHIWDGGARERVFMAFLQIELKPGVGNSTGLGVDPQAVLMISRDGGNTFGQEIRRSMGKIGNFLTRIIWRRLSFARDAVVDLKIYDPVPRDIAGATLKKGEQ